MLSPSLDVPAFRVSATARELERIRAKRRLLETVSKVAPTSATTADTEAKRPPSTTKLDADPANRNAKIKANARKLLDQLQAADTSLGDTAHNLKLMFAKQALRALAERQAAVVTEAKQRKLDKLREHLEEEHRRQHQQHHVYANQPQLQANQQQVLLPQAHLVARPPVAHPHTGGTAPSHAMIPAPVRQLSPTRQSRRRSSPSRRISRSGRDRHRRSPSRRSPSPPPVQQQLRTGEDYELLSGFSYDSDAQRSDAVHIRDTQRHLSRSKDRHPPPPPPPHSSRSNGVYYREQRSAGLTEVGMRGAVSAQALSALLAGLQLHGVNLTSGPPPPTRNNKNETVEVARGVTGAVERGIGEGGTEEQYVLLPDGTVGLVHTIVKPAVLQPQVTMGQMPMPPPHAVPLVLLQPGSTGAAGNGGAIAAASSGGASIAPWPPLPHTGVPYSFGATPPPFYPSPPVGMYGAQAQYPYPHAMYGIHGPIPPAPYPFQTSAPPRHGPESSSPPPPPPPPPYMSPYPGPDGGSYYRNHQHQQQQQHRPVQQESPSQPQGPAGTAAHLHDPQGHPYSHYRSDSSHAGHPRGGLVGQLAPGVPPHMGRDVDAIAPQVRQSISSLSSDPYGNLVGSILIGNSTEDGAGGGVSGVHRLGGSSPQSPSTATAVMSVGQPHRAPSSSGVLSPGTEALPGNGPGGSGVHSGGRYHHRRSHSGAESLRSLPSNSGGSNRGGPGSVSMSQHYELTLASPSLRGSQDLDSPASFRDMPRRASGSISLSPLRSGSGTGGAGGTGIVGAGIGSMDSGPHFTPVTPGDGSSRRRPSPLFVSSAAAAGGLDAKLPRGVPSGSSGSSSGGSIVLRVTAAGSVPAQSGSGYPGADELSGLGSAAGTGAGDEPSLLLRTLDLGSASLQRSKLSEDQAETPTSRKPSLTSPWSSSGPSDAAISASGGGLNLGVYNNNNSLGGAGGGGGMANAATFPSTRDLLSDVVSRPPLYGTSLPYGTAGLYDRYTAGGFYGATGGYFGPGPMYGALPTGSGGSFGGFDVNGGNGSLLDRGASAGSGGGGNSGTVATPQSPGSDSARSNGTAVRAYGGTALPGTAVGGPTGLSTATSDLMGTSAALALTAAILEGSPASAAASSIIAGSTVGLSAAAVYGLGQMGLSHLYPPVTAGAITPSAPGATSTTVVSPGSAPTTAAAAAGNLARSPSMSRHAQGSESSSGGGGGGGGGAGGFVSGQQGMSPASLASMSAMTRLSHGSNMDNMFSPRTRSSGRVRLMGNDDLTDAFSPRSANLSVGNMQSTMTTNAYPPPQSQLASTSSMRLTAATLNAQQQLLQQQQQQQQGPTSPPHPSPSRLGSSRSPASGTSGGSGSAAAAAAIPAGATDIGGLQPTVPTLQLPPRARSRMLGSAVGVTAIPAPPTTTPPLGAGANGLSSETTSPTRYENPGVADFGGRDIDTEQSLGARSGRSALSEGPIGGPTIAASISSVERVSGVPVVEHRDVGADAAAYAGLVGAQPYDVMADIGGGGGGSSGHSGATGFVTGGAPATAAVHRPQPGLPPLLELLSNSPFAAAASPSGSAGLSPLGFGGSSTPLERSADSFVRIGSMPFSGAASPMATANPIELLGSPTKQPQSQISAVITQGSSGGASSAGGGAGGSTGGATTSSRSAVSATISAVLPQLPVSAAQAMQQQQPATPFGSGQTQAAPAGLVMAGLQQLQPVPQTQMQVQQQQLSGMSFRMSNTGLPGAASQALDITGRYNASGTTSTATTGTGIAAAVAVATAPTASPTGGAAASAFSTHSTAAAGSSIPAAAAISTAATSTKVPSPTASRSARLLATTTPSLGISASSPSQRGAAYASFGAVNSGGARTGATAILSRVLAGRGEFDSDDDDDGGVESRSAYSIRQGPGGGSLQRRSGGAPGAGGLQMAQRASGVVLLPGRGTLTGGSTAHDDDEFNF